jgi:hypothetical protein
MVSKLPAGRSTSSEIEAFLKEAARTPTVALAKGRLIFAIDATMSRGATWDVASEIQSDMFDVAQSMGGLAVQLVWFRGRGEFHCTAWTTAPAVLAQRMREVSCLSGFTQLRRVLVHVGQEAHKTRVGVVVYVGDCFEENADLVFKEAGQLALLGVPAFMFHEGRDEHAEAVFREVARLTRGAYARFNVGAANTLRELLRAAAAYAAGGVPALRAYGGHAGAEVRRIARTISESR